MKKKEKEETVGPIINDACEFAVLWQVHLDPMLSTSQLPAVFEINRTRVQASQKKKKLHRKYLFLQCT